MELQRTRQISPQRQLGGPGEKAGGAGDTGEGPERAGPAGQAWMAPLQPQVTGEGGGQQEAAVLDPAQEGGQV